MNAPRWEWGVSSTLKGIYVIRYLMFSGGVAIAVGMLQRVLTQSSGIGLLIGAVLGLLIFRGQLKPLKWPRLLLSQDAMYLVHRKHAVTLPWPTVRSAIATGPMVAIELTGPMTSPTGEVADQIQLEARKFGSNAPAMAEQLGKLISDTSVRARLPPDQALRSRLTAKR